MESLGGLPMLGDQPGGGWDPKTYSLEDLIVKTFAKSGLIDVSVVVSSGRYVLLVSNHMKRTHLQDI